MRELIEAVKAALECLKGATKGWTFLPGEMVDLQDTITAAEQEQAGEREAFASYFERKYPEDVAAINGADKVEAILSTTYRSRIDDAFAAGASWQRNRKPLTDEVPEGWKLVPEKPTEKMILEAQKKSAADPFILVIWRAMLAAAPSTVVKENLTSVDTSERDALDARRFSWWFDTSDKTAFLSIYLEGVQQKWDLNRWRSEIDAAMRQEGGK